MSDPATCPTCGSPLPGGRTGVCPFCLLRAGMFEGGPPTDPAADGADFPASVYGGPREAPGTWIGRYRLLEELGEGGFAIVYLAEQTEPVKRRVALKILKPGMDTREVVARFAAERQTLALMDHPNIAHVYDGGTTELWRPFFVMELVAGTPLTKYCDNAHLGVRQRLELMLDVLAAVQHAHQKGIIHRDLKPSNIMVSTQDGRPVVKVIDFGIAKAMATEQTGHTAVTGHDRLIGTPEYMSPEQAGGGALDVDTRSDVYSLGVVLYELLSGRTPHDSKTLRHAGLTEIQRLLREVEPPRPSTRLHAPGLEVSRIARRRGTQPLKLRKQLRGDLDWIVMKALEKDRTRRYPSASGMAQDLQRYLSDEPVTARPPGVSYRFGKFARRNKTVLALVSLIAVILVAATVVSTWEVFQTRQAVFQTQQAVVQTRQALRESSLNAARAFRTSGESGRRSKAVAALHVAASISPGRDLRDEIVAIFGMADLQRAEEWPTTAAHNDLAAIAPDFSCIATSAADGTVTVFSKPPEPRVLATLPGTGVPANRVLCFSQDAKLLAIGHAPEGQDVVAVGIWDWRKNQRLALLPGVSREAMDFSPDGSLVAAGCGRDLVLVETRTGKELHRWPALPGLPHALRFRPDGLAAAVSFPEDSTVTVIDLADGKALATARFTQPRGIDWHRDGHRLAVACAGSVTVWNTREPAGKVVIAAEPPEAIIDRVAWSHHSELLASTGPAQQPVAIHDGSLGQTLVSASGDAKDLRFTPDDTRLGLTWDKDKLGLFQIADGAFARHAPGHGETVRCAAWDPTGGVLATVTEHSLRFWNCEMRAIGGMTFTHGTFAAFTSDSLIVVADTVRRYPFQWVGTPPVPHLGPPETLDASDDSQSASITTDGLKLAVAGHEQVIIFNLANPAKPRHLSTGSSQLDQVALSPRGGWLATASHHGGGVKVWTDPGGKLVAELPVSGPCQVSFSHDGVWLAVATSSGYHFHRAGSWKLAKNVPCRLGVDIGWLAWSPRETVFAIEPTDFMLAIHDAQNFRLETSPQFEHQRPLTFSPDGARLITTDPRHRIHQWHLALVRVKLKELGLDVDQKKIPPLPPPPLVEDVVCDPGGQ